MLPYSTDRQLQRTPWATISLIALCAIIEGFALANPGLRELLALNPSAFHLWQPLTAMFAHADPMHLIGNMLFLWVFGSHVEDTIGIPRYLLIFVTAGFAGDWLQSAMDLAFLHQVRGGIGASGAIMGLVAIFALRYRTVNVNCLYCWYYRCGTFQIKAIWLGAIYFALDLFEGTTTGALGAPSMVGNFAHVGGFVCGVVWSFILKLPDAAAVDEDRDTAAGFAAAGAFGAAAAAMTEAIEHAPADPDLRRQMASYLDMKPETAPLALPQWDAAFRLWVSRDELETALENWNKACGRHQPQDFDPQTVFDLAVALDKRGHDTEAAAAYAALAQQHREFRDAPLAGLRLAHMLARHGRADQARQWYQYVQTTWPESEEALTAEGELARA